MKHHHARNFSNLLPVAFALVALAGCQSVDLGEPGMAEKKNVPPSCDVSASDYKLLAYLRDGRDAAKTSKMLNILKGKYGSAAPVNGDNPVVAAQSYVIAKSDVEPTALEQMVTKECAAK